LRNWHGSGAIKRSADAHSILGVWGGPEPLIAAGFAGREVSLKNALSGLGGAQGV